MHKKAARLHPAFVITVFMLVMFLGDSYFLNVPDKSQQAVNINGKGIPKSLLPVLVERAGRDDSAYHISGRDDGSYTSETPGHGFSTVFSQQGADFKRSSEGVRMKLAGGENIAPQMKSENKIEYARGNIIEWYVNSPYGIEQGFTLETRPENSSGEVRLTVDLTMSEGVKAVSETEKSIKFFDSNGALLLSYSGLYVFDSRGRELPSSMRLAGPGIEIEVDDKGAEYPIVIDPLIEAQKLTASDGTQNDSFGRSVLIEGDIAFVGAPIANGIRGKVYIYERNTLGIWNEIQILSEHDEFGGSNDVFGSSISMSDDTAIIGAPGDGVLSESGAAYVFIKDSDLGTWSKLEKLTPRLRGQTNHFGEKSAIQGDVAAISAPGYDFLGSPTSMGGVYIFERDSVTGLWDDVDLIVADDADDFDRFGSDVSMSGDRLLIGASGDDSAYIYERDSSGNWNFLEKITGSEVEPGDNFGSSVSISGNIAVVGSQFSEVNENEFQGAAYIFERDDDTGLWSEIQKLSASDGGTGNRFGYSVITDENKIVIGENKDGVDSIPPGSGAAYVFSRDSETGVWDEIQKLSASNSTDGDRFSISVSISGSRILVGANEIGNSQGAAYIFEPGGTLTIMKDSDPDGGTGFGFTAEDFPNSCVEDGTFILNDDEFLTCGLVPGSYAIEETPTEGFRLTNISCIGDSSFTTTETGVTVDIAVDDTTVCTFTNLQLNQLSVNKTGEGDGNISSDPIGISCDTGCASDSAYYDPDTVVTLTATPDGNSVFTAWSGDTDCHDGIITMDADKTCTAEFSVKRFDLNVSSQGSGGGFIVSSSGGIDCGQDCSDTFDVNSIVVLFAIPDGNSIFTGWTGDPDCSDGVVTMDSSKSCVAIFDLINFDLSVFKVGTGTGTVSSTPGDIDCGQICSDSFVSGTVVNLIATPDAGSEFSGWSGDADCEDGTVTLNFNTVCTANFSSIVAPEETADLSVTKSASPGTVTVGETVTYTLTVENRGPDETVGVQLTDILPGGVTPVSASSECAVTSGRVVCNFGRMLSGDQRTVAIEVIADRAGNLRNTASVNSNFAIDPFIGNNTATVSTEVSGEVVTPSLDVEIEFDDIEVQTGSAFSIPVTLTNPAGTQARQSQQTRQLVNGVAFSVEFPQGFSIDDLVSTKGTCDVENQECSIGDMAPGEAVMVTTDLLAPESSGPFEIIFNVSTANGQVFSAPVTVIVKREEIVNNGPGNSGGCSLANEKGTGSGHLGQVAPLVLLPLAMLLRVRMRKRPRYLCHRFAG